MKKTLNISSFDEMKNQEENFIRLAQNFSLALERKNLKGIDAAIGVQVSPLMKLNGRLALLQLFELGDNEQRFLEQLSILPKVQEVIEEDSTIYLKLEHQVDGLRANEHSSIPYPGTDIYHSHIEFKSSEMTSPDTFKKLYTLLKQLVIWIDNDFFKDTNKEIHYSKIREANHKFMEACKAGNARILEMALSEGASVLGVDNDGVPALTHLMHHSDHAHLMALIVAVEPTLHLVSEKQQLFIRTIPGGRRKANASDYIPDHHAEPTLGSSIHITQTELSDRLFVYLKILEKLNKHVVEYYQILQKYSTQEYTLRWPNMIEFKKIFVEHYEPTFEELRKV